jgi:hypothetical protein
MAAVHVAGEVGALEKRKDKRQAVAGEVSGSRPPWPLRRCWESEGPGRIRRMGGTAVGREARRQGKRERQAGWTGTRETRRETSSDRWAQAVSTDEKTGRNSLCFNIR